MDETEIQLFYVDGRSQRTDASNTKLRGSRLRGVRPRVIVVHQNLLNRVGLDVYMELLDTLAIMDSPHKVVYFISDGQEIRSDPLSLRQLMKIQMEENTKEYMYMRY